MPQTVSKKSPSTNVLPSTSKARRDEEGGHDVEICDRDGSKRRTCDIGPSSRRVDRASATVGVLSISRCGTSAIAHFQRQIRAFANGG